MTFTYNFMHLRISILFLGIIFSGICLLTGCGGGGGGGGGKPLITPENKPPTASISSPTGAHFNEGENIDFGGTATDEEDGELGGDALVWTSSIDDIIGTGTAITTGALTAGDHEITLTATDSEGGTHVTDPVLIHIEQTRFIKIGKLTTGATDASNAFDGDLDTAASLMAPDTEFIHFKAHIGGADTFMLKMKLGPSTTGSVLAIQGLNSGDNTWRTVQDIDLLAEQDKTATVKVARAQDYKDSWGYINLRARWEGGGSEDNAAIYELWRIDPIYPGPQTTTTDVDNAELAFDGNPSTGASITSPWDGTAPYLHFKAYVGKKGGSNTFTFSLSHNNIGSDQLLSIDIEPPNSNVPDPWVELANYRIDTEDARKITVSNVQDYVDDDGYISLRARWVGFGSSNVVHIFEIYRIDPFFLGPKTTLGEEWEYNEGNAIDGDPDTKAGLYYYWGELDRYEFLHVQVYAGDASLDTFSIEAALSADGLDATLIVEGEQEPDNWSVIKQIIINDAIRKENIALLDPREYINSDGYLSLRIRWESDSVYHDVYIHEISSN